MKGIFDRLLQVAILVIATGATIYFEFDKKIQALLPSNIALRRQ
jgi:hypothetical protein